MKNFFTQELFSVVSNRVHQSLKILPRFPREENRLSSPSYLKSGVLSLFLVPREVLARVQLQVLLRTSIIYGLTDENHFLANLAMALAMQPSRPKVGLLDLDIFGPSVPRIMGLTDAPEPEVNKCMLVSWPLVYSDQPSDCLCLRL
jgi:hypothetical protein